MDAMYVWYADMQILSFFVDMNMSCETSWQGWNATTLLHQSVSCREVGEVGGILENKRSSVTATNHPEAFCWAIFSYPNQMVCDWGLCWGFTTARRSFWMGPRNQAVSPLLPGEMPKHVAELEIGNWSGPQFLDSQYSSYMFISSTSWSCFPVATIQVCCFRYLHICIYIYILYKSSHICKSPYSCFFEID